MHLAVWHGLGLPLAAVAGRPGGRPRAVPGPPARRPGAGAGPARAERRRGVPRRAPGRERAVRPGDRRRAERLAARLRGRDPHDGGARSRRARWCWATAGRGGRRSLGSAGHVAVCTALLVDGARGRRPSTAGSRPRCCSGPPATRWPACSSCRAAPDLALTQVAIETLTTVLFVLVLRRLPDRFESRSTARRQGGAAGGRRRRRRHRVPAGADRRGQPHRRAGVRRDGRAVGARRRRPQRRERDPRRLPGLRHLGEITVLAAAAIGSVALARAGRRPRRPGRRRGPVRLRRRRCRADPASGPAPAACAGSSWSTWPCGSSSSRSWSARSTCCSPATTSPAAGSSAASWPAPPWRCATWPAASTRCAACRAAHPWTVLGAGLLLSAATVAGARCCSAAALLESATLEADLPLLGHVKVTSALVFDIGVYLARGRPRADGVRGVRRRPGRPADADADREVHDSTGRRRAAARGRAGAGDVTVLLAFTAAVLFAHRHLPGAAAQAQPHHHRRRPARPRRQRAAGELGPAGASRRSSATATRRRLRRPAAAGAGADRHRHQLRRHRPPAGAGLPELAAHRRRRGAGRRRGHADRPPRRRPTTTWPTPATRRNPTRTREDVAP